MKKYKDITIIVAAVMVVVMTAVFGGLSLANSNRTADLSGLYDRLDELIEQGKDKENQTIPTTDLSGFYDKLDELLDELKKPNQSDIDLSELTSRLDEILSQLSAPTEPPPSTDFSELLERLNAIEILLQQMANERPPEETPAEPILIYLPVQESYTILTEFSVPTPYIEIQLTSVNTGLYAIQDCRVIIENEEFYPIVFRMQIGSSFEVRVSVQWYNGAAGITPLVGNGTKASTQDLLGTIRYGVVRIQVWHDGNYYNPRNYFDFEDGMPKEVQL
jgi:hypothetical protein